MLATLSIWLQPTQAGNFFMIKIIGIRLRRKLFFPNYCYYLIRLFRKLAHFL